MVASRATCSNDTNRRQHVRLIVDDERSFEERDAFAALDEIANVARCEGLGALTDDELELLSALGSGEMRDAAHVRLDRALPYVHQRRNRRRSAA
jgi:hypothetical protein